MQSADVTNEDILDNTSNVLFISHRRPTYIREWFEQRSKRRRRQHDNSALGNSEILTYRIVSYSKKLTQKDVQTAIVKALRKWAKVIPMLLRLGSQKTDLNIRFVEGKMIQHHYESSLIITINHHQQSSSYITIFIIDCLYHHQSATIIIIINRYRHIQYQSLK